MEDYNFTFFPNLATRYLMKMIEDWINLLKLNDFLKFLHIDLIHKTVA